MSDEPDFTKEENKPVFDIEHAAKLIRREAEYAARHVMSWRLFESFCIEVLRKAMEAARK